MVPVGACSNGRADTAVGGNAGERGGWATGWALGARGLKLKDLMPLDAELVWLMGRFNSMSAAGSP